MAVTCIQASNEGCRQPYIVGFFPSFFIHLVWTTWGSVILKCWARCARCTYAVAGILLMNLNPHTHTHHALIAQCNGRKSTKRTALSSYVRVALLINGADVRSTRACFSRRRNHTTFASQPHRAPRLRSQS